MQWLGRGRSLFYTVECRKGRAIGTTMAGTSKQQWMAGVANTGEQRGSSGAGSKPVSAGPERLQTAIRITTPGSWIIGAVFAFVTVAVIVWGVVGQLTTRVSGLGIVLASNEDIIEVQTASAGTVVEMPRIVGDPVKKDQLIARIGKPGGDAEIDSAWKRIERMQAELDRRRKSVKVELDGRKSATENHKAALAAKKATLNQRLGYLESLLKTLEAERRQRLVTEAQVQTVRNDIADTKISLNEIDIEIAQADLDYIDLQTALQGELNRMEQALADAEGDLETLRQTQADETLVTTPIPGRVISIEARVGDVVPAGSPIARIYADGGKLGVYTFVKAADGKKVSAGMDVSVSPSTAERAIWGSIKAKVKSVSELPETVSAVNTILVNQELTDKMFASGPPILIEVELLTDPKTPSGLAWTSGQGPPYRITHGTLSAVSVVIREEAPANLVIPVFWSWIGHGS